MLTAYRILMTLALPLLLAGVLWRRLRGHAVPGEATERLGLGAPAPAPLLWLHGASNGEITSARWLVEDLLVRAPDLHVRITCNNPTARRMVEGWGLPRVSAALAPWDAPLPVGRFLSRQRPLALLSLENELWPVRLTACAASGAPVIALGARLSATSAGRWARLAPSSLRRILASLAYLSAQDPASEQRFLAAGLPADRLGPRLVLKSRLATETPAAPFATPPRPRCLLAASTHEGEDAAILDAFRQTRDLFDLLILAPRHPQRGPEIARLAQARGLDPRLRSRDDPAEGPVYIADTLGEMPLWYTLCGATFIGGTLVEKGGHTPFEPAAHGSALIHGPSVHNFAEVFASLDAAGAARRVADADSLAAALAGLTPEVQGRMAGLALDTLPPAEDAGALFAAIARLTGLPVAPT